MTLVGCGWFPKDRGLASFHTPNLRLEPFAAAHVDFVQNAAAKWEVARWLSRVPHPYPEGGASDFLAQVQSEFDACKHLNWIVSDRDSGAPLGLIGLRCIEHEQGTPWELGYWYTPSAWGRGVATEAAFHVLTFAFRFMALEVVSTAVLNGNHASRRVLEKVGFDDWSESTIETAHSQRQPHYVAQMTAADFEAFVFSGGCTFQPQIERAVPVVWVAAAALFDAADRVLVAQRPVGKALAGLWEFPGGKIEPLESPEAALIRELKEELAIDVGEGCLAPLTFASHAYPTFHLMMPLYAINKWQGEPRGQEGQALQWVTKAELRTLPTPPADAPLLPAVLDWM